MDAKRLTSPAFLTCLGLVGGAGAILPFIVWWLGLVVFKKPIEAEFKLTSIPAETPVFRMIGKDERYGKDVQETLGTENYISRIYVDKAPPADARPRAIELHVAYYTGTIDTVPHVPDRCMVGAGWSIAGGPWIVPVPLDRGRWIEDDAASAEARAAGTAAGSVGADSPIFSGRLSPASHAPGNRVRLPRGIEHVQMRVTEFEKPGTGQRMFAGFFFIANGGLTPRAEEVRLLAYDLRSDYAYYAKVQVSSEQVKSAEELARVAADLLDDLLPDVMQCVPDWTDVLRGDYPPDNPRRHGAPSALQTTPINRRPHADALWEGSAWHLA